MKYILSVALVSFSLACLQSVCLAGMVDLDSKQFHESYVKEVKISGSVRAGVMFQSHLMKIEPRDLYINIGETLGTDLDVKMISIDGRYEAEFSYQVKENSTGLTRFNIPTQMAHIVSQYPPDHLAVLARLKGNDTHKKDVVVPATWGKPQSKNITILLNSGVSNTHLKLYRPDGTSEKLACHKIDAGTTTAYDTECLVEDFSQYDLNKTKIIRKNFDSFYKPIHLSIQCF
ncbi:MAG: hypothetical protein KKD44_17970 [Proteobacteria bacterium]|nr:hypothetical protein [Pseudomonadota bacterium]